MTTATLISAPAPEPVSLAMAKLQCRVEHSDEDALIGSIIVAMREQAETALGRPLGLQTWRVEADGQPQGTALLLERIPGVPLADVTAIAVVEYRDEAGAWQTGSSPSSTRPSCVRPPRTHRCSQAPSAPAALRSHRTETPRAAPPGRPFRFCPQGAADGTENR